MVTIHDLAQALGLSSGTVSMALNNRKGVSEQTRLRVMRAAKKMGYEGGLIHKKEQGRGTICLVVYQKHGQVVADTHFFVELIQSVERNAKALNYQIVLRFCQDGESAEQALEDLARNPPDGVLLLGTEMRREDYDKFAALALPTVLMDCDLPGVRVDKVLIDNVPSTQRAVQYLYDCGHRRIGHLRSSVWIQNFEERRTGYLAQVAALGCEPEEFALAPTLEGAARDMEALLRNGARLPPALFADNDIIACGAMKAMKKMGINLPEEVSVVGFDDVALCTLIEPELTSVSVSQKALGALSVKQVHWRILKPRAPFVRVRVDTGFTQRKSVRVIE